jgi:hemolysin activation/secretion protein
MDDKYGKTQFSLGLNMSFRNLVTDQREFEIKRFMARGNYIYATAGIERFQKLPYRMNLFTKLDGQIANEPLISNEQYVAGGMESVRGYQESELSGDNALHGSIELNFPGLENLPGLLKKIKFTSYMFFDAARLWIKNPLPGEERHQNISGTGAGIRGEILDNFEYTLEGSFALKDTDYVRKGHRHLYFRMKYKF